MAGGDLIALRNLGETSMPSHFKNRLKVAGILTAAMMAEAIIAGGMFVNFGFSCDWANDLLVDMIRSARAPGSVAKPFDESFADRHNCGAGGWPLEDFGIVVVTNSKRINGQEVPQPGHLTGRHQLVFSGYAEVSSASAGVTVTPMNAGGNAYWIDCDASATSLWLTFRNVRSVDGVYLWRGGEPGNNVLTAAARAVLAPFGGFRTMDWGTNHSQEQEWADRVRPGDAPRHQRIVRFPDGSPLPWGYTPEAYPPVPWETHIAVARELRKDLWLCVPAMASDDYIRQLADLFAAQFPIDLTLYVEYANETWNALFEANLWMVNDLGGGSWDKFRDMRAARLLFISDAFKAAMGDRCKIVCAGQVGYAPSTEWQQSDIDRIKAAGRDPAKVIDLIAMAPYIDLDWPAKLDAQGKPLVDQWGNVVTIDDTDKPAFVATLTLPQIRDILLSKINGWVSSALDTYAAFAKANGIAGVAAYEWGVEPYALAAIRDTPEGAEVMTAFARLLAAKTQVACFFDLAGDGYSIMDYLDTPTQAFNGLVAAIGQLPPPAPSGPPVPVPDPIVVTPPPVNPPPPPTPAPIVRKPYVLKGLTSVLPADFVPGWYEPAITSLTVNAAVQIPRVVVSINGIEVAEIYPHAKPRMMLAGAHYFQPGNVVTLRAVETGFALKSAILNPLPIAGGA
jgi:hypothetical protein